MKTYGGHYLRSADLRALGMASVGDDVSMHSTCVLVGLENLSLGNHVRIDAFCCILPGEGRIAIGDHVHIAANSFLSGAEGIEIGDFAGLSYGVRLYTRGDDYSGHALTNPTVPAKFLGIERGPVRLGRHVIIGAGSVVLPGVAIAEGTAVGALSLVRSDLAPWGIYFGAPVRRLRERSRDLLDLEAQLRAAEAAT